MSEEKDGGAWELISNVGGGIAIIAVLSFFLHYFGMEIRGLDLIDKWGYQTGIFIRLGMIFIGGLIWILARKQIK